MVVMYSVLSRIAETILSVKRRARPRSRWVRPTESETTRERRRYTAS